MDNKELKIGFVYDVKFFLKDLPRNIFNHLSNKDIENNSYIIEKCLLIKKKDKILSKLYKEIDFYELDNFKYDSLDDYEILPECDYLVELFDTVLSIDIEQILNISKCEKDGLIYLQNASIGQEYYIIGSLLNDNIKFKLNAIKETYKKRKFQYNNKTYRHLFFMGDFTYNDKETDYFGNVLTKLRKV